MQIFEWVGGIYLAVGTLVALDTLRGLRRKRNYTRAVAAVASSAAMGILWLPLAAFVALFMLWLAFDAVRGDGA